MSCRRSEPVDQAELAHLDARAFGDLGIEVARGQGLRLSLQISEQPLPTHRVPPLPV
jgi:hypothetical protein